MVKKLIVTLCTSLFWGQSAFSLEEDNAAALRQQENKNIITALERKYEDHIEPVIHAINSFEDGYSIESWLLFGTGFTGGACGLLFIPDELGKMAAGAVGLVVSIASWFPTFHNDKDAAFCEWKKGHKKEFRDAQDAINATDTYKHLFKLTQTQDGK